MGMTIEQLTEGYDIAEKFRDIANRALAMHHKKVVECAVLRAEKESLKRELNKMRVES